jgi:hypothetical protein
MLAESVLDLDLKDVNGIGPKTKEKLIEGGIESVLDLAAALPKELESVLGGSEENAASMVLSAKKLLAESGLIVKSSSRPARETPKSIILYVQNGGVSIMGRITPSFRQSFQSQIEELRRSNGFQNTLLDLSHKEALNSLIEEAWSPEGATMSNSGIQCVLDVLNLMANVHNKKVNNSLRSRIEELEKRLKDLSEKCSTH